MARSYLDKIGLGHLWDLFKAYLMRRNLVPEQSKTFEGVIATANSDPAGFLYFGEVKPDDYYIPYKIKYHMEIEITGLSSTTQSKSDFNVEIRGLNNTYYGYRIDNVVNTNYRSIYSHIFYPCTLTGYNKGYGGLVGIRLQSAYNPANTANARIVKIEILETENCTFKFFDSMTLYADVEGSGSANYYSRYAFEGIKNGHIVYGDANDANYYNRNYYANRKAAAPIYRYQLCVSKKDRSVLSLSTVDNNVSTNKTLTTESFDPFGDILYWNSNTTYTTGVNVGDGWYNQYLADIRYTFNIGGNGVASTLVARKPLYLVTVLQSDGNVKLHSNPLAQDLPTTEDGLLYIYLGQVQPDTNPYRLYMSLHHPIYLFKNGHITNYTNNNDFVSVEQKPYSFRKSGDGVAVGDTEYDKIVGGTVNWNQLAFFTARDIPYNANGITYAYTDGTSVKITGTATAVEQRTGWFGLSETQELPVSRLGHKMIVTTRVVSGSFDGNINYSIGGSLLRPIGTSYMGPLTITSSDNKIRFQTQIASGTVCDDLVLSINVFDLTQMFGTEIADYVYSIEQANVGAGVAWFKALFPNDYYEHNSGELLSVSGLSEHKMVGFNQWDEEWETGGISTNSGLAVSSNVAIRSKSYNKILGNTTYYINTPYGSTVIFFYDEQKKYISYLNIKNNIFTTLEDAFFFKVRVGAEAAPLITYNHDICINLSDPAKNGTYEPYKGHSYPLDSTLTLRGLFKLDVNNKLYADGDTYDADGKVTRRYRIVDLGTLNWTYTASVERFAASVPRVYGGKVYTTLSWICQKYETKSTGWQDSDRTDKVITVGGTQILVRDSAYTDAATFKAAMSGVMLAYELATPTTEQATPYQNPQSVNEYGTEEYVSTSIIPIGHYTEYPASKTLIKNVTNNYNDIATQNKMGYMSASDKTKLDGIATEAEVNQNTFSNVKVGTTTISADTKTDTLELSAGTNITLTPDATNDKVTINATDTKYSAGNGIGLNGTTFSNTGVTGIKGNAESSYRTGQVNLTAANIGAVATTGNETVSGNKTFSGTTTITPSSTFSSQSGDIVSANSSAIIQSPIPKYLWHDIWAFCRASTPKYYTSADGSTWVKSTLEKNLFAHKEAWGESNVLSSSIKGSRWTWLGGDFYASTASWIVLGVTYKNPSAHFDLLLETSSDNGSTWSTILSVTNLYYNQTPIWIKNSATCQNSLRLTLTWNNNSASNAVLGLCSIRFLASRWGEQGKGGEFEYPFVWDGTPNVYPIRNGGSDLGTSSNKWNNVNANNFNGNLNGNVTGNVTGDVTGKTSSMLIQPITSNTNLNTIINDGWYRANTDEIATSLTNSPTSKSFLLEVFHIYDGNKASEIIFQRITSSQYDHYERVKTTGGWQAWKSTAYIDDNGVVHL